MKKLMALVLVAGMTAFVACGPSKKDMEAKEKAKRDSLRLDSIAKVREADSLAAVEKENKRFDSLKQDSIKKARKHKGTKNKHKAHLNKIKNKVNSKTVGSKETKK